MPSDCQSNTKTIEVLLRPGPSGDLVVESKLSPRGGFVALKEATNVLKIYKKFHEKNIERSQEIEDHTAK